MSGWLKKYGVALLVGAAGIVVAPAVQADSLIENVNGMTLDSEGKVIRFTAMLVDDDGRVKQLLDRRDKRPREVDFQFDGKGQTLIPGFFDAHGHVMDMGFGALTLDLSETKTLAEALAKISQYAADNAGRQWILGTGWNQETWGLGRFPTAPELDAAVPDRPVFLSRVDGHAVWVNGAAMAAAGVSGSSKSPSGGTIVKIGGKPSGIFVDAAMALFNDAIPAPKPAERDLAFGKAQDILLANGVTSIADMGTTMQDWQSFRRAGDKGQLKIRIISYAGGIDNMIAIAGPAPSPWLYDDHLKLAGVKLYIDGALGSRGALLKQPYADMPGESGLAMLTSAQLKNKMSRAAMDGFQTAVHAIGDKANDEILSAIEELEATYKGDRRWRVEHAQIIDPVDISRFAATGTIASMQPVHQTSDRLMAEARLGPDRINGAYAWKSLLDSGAVLAFGTDVPVESSNPFAGLAAAITREDGAGQPFGGWMPSERLKREQAWQAYTQGAAYAAFAEDRLGSLEPGKRADFLIVDQDMMLATPAQIRNMKVLQTWIGGKPVFIQK
ncbi:MAG: amidohydrolase [Sphingomonadales bacterium]|nr:amidohydrolase [Sphingomonadales bacterium]PIX66040.1 MAG: metal-dependent hydrolase [Sphingomonadales bacterium CG_4_10_14_3_um_filter_58_15]NCO50279.1 amidohydrolase [Sphingomonadales bacterium]NCP01535.1 amidohydrolase [Sphingomonadales bacterium]NCP26744.1 amidohydrolase [Sphingomonadales bacterium]